MVMVRFADGQQHKYKWCATGRGECLVTHTLGKEAIMSAGIPRVIPRYF
jgi:hypothetical protein